MKLEIKIIGESAGLILPDDLLARMNLARGDIVYLTELPDGGFKIDRANPDHDRAMEIAREVFDEYEGTFKALAK